MTGGPGCNVNETLHCPRSKDDEYRTAFATWVIASSPLIVSTDIRNMTSVMKQCLLNKEAIMINQDYTMPAGKLIGQAECGTGATKDQCPIMHRPLSDGTHAILLTNLHDDTSQTLKVSFSAFNFSGTATVRDVILQKDLGTASGSYSATLQPHESALLRISKQ